MLMQRIEQGMSTAYYAQHHGGQPAVIEIDRVTTFAQLNAHANQLVRALRQRGLKAGDAVALLCSNRVEFVVAIVALERSGLRITPINTHLTGDEVGYILDNCEAKAFIAESRYAAQAQTGASLAKRAVVKFANDNDKIKVVGGYMNGQVLSESAVKALAILPSLDELRSKLIAIVQTPATKLAILLKEPGTRVARVISAKSAA